MIHVEALLFDLDGTLIDSKTDLAHAVQYLQKYYKASISTEREVAGFIGDGVTKLVERALPELSKRDLPKAVETMKSFYRKHCLESTKLYPGVKKTLEHFRHKKMAVVTNKPVRISGYMLDQLGLSAFFKLVIGGDSLPNKKPHPEPVLSALKTLGVINTKHAVMVGDSPNDVDSGRASGILTCGIHSNIGDTQKLLNSRPDFVVRKMHELMRLFN